MVTEGVALEIGVRRRKLGVGDKLKLQIVVHNNTGDPITVVRPVYGSWEHARHPDYRLEFTDAHGNAVPDPLGFAPGLSCGVLDPITDEDRVVVEPERSARIGNDAVYLPEHDVLPSARPGRYQLRLRYLAEHADGGTPMNLISNPVEIEITSGDEAMWGCRARQEAFAKNHTYSKVSPVRLLPIGPTAADGYHLVYSRYIHHVRNGKRIPKGEILIRRLDRAGDPVGDPVSLVKGEEAGFVAVEPAPGGFVMAWTPGPVGGRSVKVAFVETRATGPRIGKTFTVQEGPGNPYFLQMARSGDRIAILHEGLDAERDPTVIQLVDDKGAPIARRRLARDVISFDLQAESAGFVATWTQRGGVDRGVRQRLDVDGRKRGRAVQFDADPSNGLAGVHHHATGFDVAYHDSSMRGDNPSDTMGMYVARFDDRGRRRGSDLRISPASKRDAYFGSVAWLGSSFARAHASKDRIRFGIGTRAARVLSDRIEGEPQVTTVAGNYVVLWSDASDDDSAACLRMDDCVGEAWLAIMRPDGTSVIKPKRVTRESFPKPLLPSSHDWRKYCP